MCWAIQLTAAPLCVAVCRSRDNICRRIVASHKMDRRGYAITLATLPCDSLHDPVAREIYTALESAEEINVAVSQVIMIHAKLVTKNPLSCVFCTSIGDRFAGSVRYISIRPGIERNE